MTLPRAACILLISLCLTSTHAVAATWSNIFVFGDSLADAGNNFIGLNGQTTPTPISGNDFIAHDPYASTRYSNGPVWVEDFAAHQGFALKPSLLGGTDYAFGGATTSGPDHTAPTLFDQAGFFLKDYKAAAPSDALYLIEGGGNNARDALEVAAASANPLAALSIVAQAATAYAQDELQLISLLRSKGARTFLVANVPDLGRSPAVMAGGSGAAAAATFVAQLFNQALQTILPVPGVTLFDDYTTIDAVLDHRNSHGLTNVTDACAAGPAVCTTPESYFFWDGIHPTAAGHRLIAEAAISAIPEPSAAALMLPALGLLALARQRRRA